MLSRNLDIISKANYQDFPLVVAPVGGLWSLPGLQAFCPLYSYIYNESKNNTYFKGLLRGLMDWSL